MAYKVIYDMNFSIAHSGVVYFSSDSVAGAGEFKRLGWETKGSPIFRQDGTGDKFFAKRIRYYDDTEDLKDNKDEYVRQHYLYMLQHPPKTDRILWPKDMIEIADPVLEDATLLVANNYRVYANDVNVDQSPYALLFPYHERALLFSVRRTLEQYITDWKNQRGSQSFHYRQPDVRKLAYALAYSLYELNESGYLYNDIDTSRFFLNQEGFVVLDFSNLIYTPEELSLLTKQKSYIEEPREFPLPFAEPAVFQRKVDIPDAHSQNYSLCALLFYILFGLKPYEGPLVDYMDDSTRMSRFNKCQQYLNNPVFIFDPEDDRNHLGIAHDYEIYISLWEECPQEIKDMFRKTLIADNAARIGRKGPLYAPTPMEWLQVFTKYNWI